MQQFLKVARISPFSPIEGEFPSELHKTYDVCLCRIHKRTLKFNFQSTFYKQKVQNLSWHRVMWRLVWVCIVCKCPQKWQNANLMTCFFFKYILFINVFQCNAGLANYKMFEYLQQPPIKIMLLGCGCSTETESTAQVSHMFNITQVKQTISAI